MIDKTAKRSGGAVLALALVLLAGPAMAQSPPVTLVAYTSLQKEVLAPYEAAFRKVHPEIQITWVRDAGGVIHCFSGDVDHARVALFLNEFADAFEVILDGGGHAREGGGVFFSHSNEGRPESH